MARSLADIYASGVAEKNTHAELSGLAPTADDLQTYLSDLTNPSKVAMWRHLLFVTSLMLWTHEKLWDKFKALLDIELAKAAPGTRQWWQKRIFEFQYDTSTPQYVQLDPVYFVPNYATPNSALCIVSQCSVTVNGIKTVIIKVAKGPITALVQLTGPELTALQAYIDTIQFAGVTVVVVSLPSDKLRVGANIWYRGEYTAAWVKAKVIDAINEYFRTLPFDGIVDVQKLTDAIQAVPGVEGVVLEDVKARPDSIPLTGSYTHLVIAGDIQIRKYTTSAGYIVAETTALHTLNDTLVLLAA